MTQITLSSEQAAIFSSTSEPVCVLLPNGAVAGFLKKDITPKEPLFTPAEIAEAERRANAPGKWYTTKEVLEYLDSLDNQ